jgi:uncharacterized protein (TIGR04255 family)
MARQRHLPNAPITEALIDLQVESPHKIDAAASEVLTLKLLGSYELQGPIHFGQIAIEGAKDLDVKVATQDVGYRFHSVDGQFVALLRHQGFTLSRLAPYTEWGHLKAEAERLWPMYLEVSKPVRVSRVACRYINNLNLPVTDGQDFGDFLTAAPDIPPTLPQKLLSFVQRVVIGYPDLPGLGILTQLLDPNTIAAPGRVSVILDVDIQCHQIFDPARSDLWSCLERLHTLKNDAFFESITEATAELYE